MMVAVTRLQDRGTVREEAAPAEFEGLLVASWSPVFRYCLSFTHRADEAEEATAETFRRA